MMTAHASLDVIQKDQSANLILVISGEAEVTVGEGVVVRVQRPGLLGESSLIRGSVATKTVSVLPDCRFVLWERAALKSLLDRKPSVQRGLDLMIGQELSRKLGETSHRLTSSSLEVTHVEYEATVLRFTLRLLAEERLFVESHRSHLFDALSEYRKLRDIPSEVHTRAMERLGINEDICIRQNKPLRSLCLHMASSEIPCSRLKPSHVESRRLERPSVATD